MAHGFIELDRPVVHVGFPCGSAGVESAYNVEDLGSIPELGRSLGEGTATQSSILAWRIPPLYSLGGLKKLDTTKLLSLSLFMNKKLRIESVKVENVSKKKKNPCGPGWRSLFGTYSVLGIKCIVCIKCPNIYLCSISKYYDYYPKFYR